jgi:hypothetical protein
MTPTTDHTTAKLDIMDDDTLDRAFATAKSHAAELREWAQKWRDAWNTQDLDGVVALVDEDIVYEDPAMLGEHIRGRAQFRAVWPRGFEPWLCELRDCRAPSPPAKLRTGSSATPCQTRVICTSSSVTPTRRHLTGGGLESRLLP